MKTFVYQGTTLSGPFELAAVINMSYENSTITMEDLEAGSSYKIQFSVSLYEGIYILNFVFYEQLANQSFHKPNLLFRDYSDYWWRNQWWILFLHIANFPTFWSGVCNNLRFFKSDMGQSYYWNGWQYFISIQLHFGW